MIQIPEEARGGTGVGIIRLAENCLCTCTAGGNPCKESRGANRLVGLEPSQAAVMEAKLNIWIEQDGEVVVSLWRVQLLEAVARTGSINAAAAEMGVHFRTAWEKIKEMETRLGVSLVESQTGGSGGGGTALTSDGRRLVARFQHLTTGLESLLAERFAEEFGGRSL